MTWLIWFYCPVFNSSSRTCLANAGSKTQSACRIPSSERRNSCPSVTGCPQSRHCPSNATNFFLRIISAVTGSFSVGMAYHLFSLIVLRTPIGIFHYHILVQASIRNRLLQNRSSSSLRCSMRRLISATIGSSGEQYDKARVISSSSICCLRSSSKM